MLRETAPSRVLGIMSGTSLDGVDGAVCDITPDKLELRELWSVGFPLRLRKRLDAAARGEATSWELAQTHHDLGRFYAAVALAHAKGPTHPQLVGLHGQTVFHQPSAGCPATLQLGEPAYLAAALRVPVVSNFRAGDLAAGGQGAPLATLFHVRVFGQPGRHVCVNNLGGISNVTSIDGRARGPARVKAFDTGPGNLLLDLLMRKVSKGARAFDRDGRVAAAGKPCEALLKRWLQHPFFARRPPKSTGRELFGDAFLEQAVGEMRAAKLRSNDMLATLTEFTAQSLVLNYRRHLGSLPELVILAGGGAANLHLRRRIESGLRALNPDVSVAVTEDFGWPRASIEASAFALLAWLRLRGEPGNLPKTTGARRAVCLGEITDLGS